MEVLKGEWSVRSGFCISKMMLGNVEHAKVQNAYEALVSRVQAQVSKGRQRSKARELLDIKNWNAFRRMHAMKTAKLKASNAEALKLWLAVLEMFKNGSLKRAVSVREMDRWKSSRAQEMETLKVREVVRVRLPRLKATHRAA